MRSPLAQLLAIGPELAAYIFTAHQLQGATAAFSQTAVASPNLYLHDLGRVAVGGDFDSIQIYAYNGQNENLSSNGSQSLLTRYPDGTFQSLGLVDADSSIAAMCPFIAKDGTDQGIIVAGNFTSLGGVHASSIAIWHPDTGEIEPLAGLSGPVRAVYCDQESATVYVGGDFMAGNSTNAMAWVTGWVNLPFAGFNGPVNSIVKNSAGNIVFGGEFNGLGNASTPSQPDAQVVNLGGGTIAVSTPATAPGSSDPSSIICSTGESGNNWLLPDGIQGWWQGTYGFGFVPTKLRLYNTVQDGRGTKYFYFENLSNGGILNLTYTDPSTGETQSCIQACPLPENNSTAQDFHFVNYVGMSGFRIWISEYYGAGGGLSGIEMFQDDIYSYAVNDFNEPQCDGVSQASSSTANPANLWVQKPNNNQTPADYLSATLTTEADISPDTNVVFTPNLQESGNYSVTVYTPGCILDGSCATRGQVNVTASVTSNAAPNTTTLYQTNNYDKYDQIYYGYIDTENFRPSVTLAPLSGQSVPLTVVASRVRFELINSTGGLNGLFEYNPNQAAIDTSDFSSSPINAAGESLGSGAIVNQLAILDDTVYAAGNFSGTGISNIMSITNKATPLPGGGLNGAVVSMRLNDSSLYIGGTFDNTADGSVPGLSNLALYSISDKSWTPLGAGVDGSVYSIVPLDLNVTTDNMQSCFAISGNFTSVNAFSGNDAFDATGFAVWVPALKNWLNNIPNATVALEGRLTAYATAPDTPALYGGTITSQGLDLADVVELAGDGQPALQSLGIRLQTLQSNSTSTRKRALTTQESSQQNFTGVYDGYFYEQNDLNITVIGGSFSATASDGSTVDNLVFVNNTDPAQTISGIPGLASDSIVVAMDTYNTLLFAGGAIDGTIRGNDVTGLVVFDLSINDYPATHPPALGGDEAVIVNAIATQPSSSLVFVGGQFQNAGGLQCATLCSYDAEGMQWQAVGFGLSGTINDMFWASNTQLLIAGNLTVNGNATTLASYDSKKQTFTEFDGASNLPGPISTITAVKSDGSEFWVAGVATSNSSAYLSLYSGGTWTTAGGLDGLSTIRKVQIMPLQPGHDDTPLMAGDQALLILGNIIIPNQGNASAVLFDGTTYTPYILTSMNDGSQGSLSAIFVQYPGSFTENNEHHLALGLVVLIGLAIALGIIMLMVLAGVLLERNRRLKEGYVPMSVDKSSNIARLPPETLFQNLEGKSSPPKL